MPWNSVAWLGQERETKAAFLATREEAEAALIPIANAMMMRDAFEYGPPEEEEGDDFIRFSSSLAGAPALTLSIEEIP
jgi:hypothetical protein